MHRHHVLYGQHVRQHAGDLADERNLVPLAFGCHFAHHQRSRVLPLSVLPDAAFEFAAELMGAAGFDYLRRYYAGDDPRLGSFDQLRKGNDARSASGDD